MQHSTMEQTYTSDYISGRYPSCANQNVYLGCKSRKNCTVSHQGGATSTNSTFRSALIKITIIFCRQAHLPSYLPLQSVCLFQRETRTLERSHNPGHAHKIYHCNHHQPHVVACLFLFELREEFSYFFHILEELLPRESACHPITRNMRYCDIFGKGSRRLE